MALDAQIAANLPDQALAPGSYPADELFRLLASSVVDYAIFLLDPAGRVVSWNAGAERIKGYRPAEILGRHFSLFYPPPEARERAQAALQRAEREGRDHQEGWRLRKDGTRFWADVVITALRGPMGELRGFAKVTRDMTARQRERENEMLLAAMFERTPAGIAMADPTGRFIRANPGFLRMLGYSAEELMQKSIGDLSHADDLAETWRVFEDLVQGRRNQADYEKRMLRRNGQPIWVRMTVARLPDADGRLRCILGMIEDITERRRADDALRESEARLQAFTNNSPALMFLKDREGRYRFVNEPFLQRYHLRRDQVIGYRAGEIFPPDQASEHIAHDDGVLARGEPVHFEQGAPHAPGERFSMVSKFPVLDAAGAVVGVGGISTDITERKAAEQALREQRTLLAEAQKLAGLGCWEWDPASGRVTWSDEMYRIYGVEPAKFRPTFETYLDCVHPEDRANTGTMLARALMDNRAFSIDERIVRPGGEVRQLRSHGEVVRDETGRPIKMVGACIDVTEQKDAEAALRAAAANLQALTRRLVEVEESERRRVARELHDRVGQNLSALNINLDIVLGSLQDSVLRRRLEDSLKLVDGTLQSIENVMADLRPPLLDEYGLAAALAWYGEEYSQRTGIRVVVEAPEGAGELRPETAVAFFRIAQEALNNAAKHSGAKSIRVLLEERQTQIALSIADDGCGFDAAKAPRGRWGMSTMRERAEAAGGRLRVESAPGKGTTVTVAVPL